MNDLYPDLTNLLRQVEDCIQDLGGAWLGRLGIDRDELLPPSSPRPRASILLLSAECSGGVSGSSLMLAAVVEIIHAALLIHGKVLDDARPQHPECTHANPKSVLFGDCLLALAWELLATEKTERFLPDLARATRQICRGRIEELRTQDRPVSRKQYLEMILAKTGSLFAFCGQAGAQTCGGSPEVVDALRTFGEQFGVAFQIGDDISNPMDSNQHSRYLKHLGIPSCGLPLPPVVPAECGREDARIKAEQVLDAEGDPPANLQAVGQGALLEGSASYWRAIAEQWLGAARARLAPLPESAAKRALQATTPAGLRAQGMISR